jgi:hypothetical protein
MGIQMLGRPSLPDSGVTLEVSRAFARAGKSKRIHFGLVAVAGGGAIIII